MTNLYVTADAIGTATGGGKVTHHESQALASVGETQIWQFPDEPRPWGADLMASARLEAMPLYAPLRAHFYSGTFTKTIKILRARGTVVTYTAAAHDIAVSRREHERLGIPFDYPHLTDPAQWAEYLRGYQLAQIVVCPSEYSAKIMRGYGCENVIVIPHGFDPPARIAPMPERFVVGYLGQPGPDKGLTYLIEAWGLWSNPSRSDTLLTIAGRGTLGVLPWIRELGASGSFYVRGEVAEPSDLYDACCLYVQSSACLVAGSAIQTTGGATRIEDLAAGDVVIAGDGTTRNVLTVSSREYDGEIVDIRASGCDRVAMTPEHRVLCIQRRLETRVHNFAKRLDDYERCFQLREANRWGARKISRELGISESMVTGWIHYGTKPEGRGANDSLRESVVGRQPAWATADDLEAGDVLVIPRLLSRKDNPDPGSMFRNTSRSPCARLLPTVAELGADLLELIGLYISEGTATTDGDIAFSFHKDELAYHALVRDVLGRWFGLPTRDAPASDGGDGLSVWCNSVNLSSVLADMCGRGAHNKRLPIWALESAPDMLVPLIRGCWRGDGSIYVGNRQQLGASYSTVSRDLAHQMATALRRLGIRCYLHSASRNVEFSVNVSTGDIPLLSDLVGMPIPVRRESSRVVNQSWMDDRYQYVRIREIDRRHYSGRVHNLHIEGEHSYCAPFVVHNSEGFGCEVLEARAHGRPVICTDGAGASEHANLVIPACDPKAIAAAIAIWHRKWCAGREAMIDLANPAAIQHLTWDCIRRRYVALFS